MRNSDSEKINLSKTALLLIGFQNDYFSPDGILHEVLEDDVQNTIALNSTLSLLKLTGKDFGSIISTPIVFTDDYSELNNPVGVLATIKEARAFQKDSYGGATISQLDPYHDLIEEIPGKRGLNAFSNTNLEKNLREKHIDHIVLAGAVTSLCIDSTGRHAADLGLNVTILEDCTSGRSTFEQNFYCEHIFPLYARVRKSNEL